MEPLAGYPIVDAVRACLRSLNTLVASVKECQVESYATQMPGNKIQNHRDRFKIWAGGLGALQHGRASLDHRLKESPVMRSAVLTLLEQLQEVSSRSMSPIPVSLLLSCY